MLAIWIWSAEATVLALALESVETPRPFPYKLAAGLVEPAGSPAGFPPAVMRFDQISGVYQAFLRRYVQFLHGVNVLVHELAAAPRGGCPALLPQWK